MPEFVNVIHNDQEFVRSEFLQPMVWLQKEYDNLYDPSYIGVLRVAFTPEFRRGRL
ncbi:MAG TPA: hypothetical protein GXX30_02975 [Firmicutes bacterium]|nr:hypothetical protein [Candidatus Fermentithermobacillaceae bacterium]